MRGPNDNKQIPPELAMANANKVAAVLILGAVLSVFMGVMLPYWAKDPDSYTTFISISCYVIAALGVGLAIYVRSAVRKVVNAQNASVIRRD